MTLIAFAAACLMALIHLFVDRLRFLDVIPRSRMLSASSGALVAFIFLHLLPELSRAQADFREQVELRHPLLDDPVFLMALIGLLVFYALERMAKRSRERGERLEPDAQTSAGVFRVSIASFSAYNVLIGYLLLHLREPGLMSLLLYAAAMMLHFLVNDYGLKIHHKRLYRTRGRWYLALAILSGWAIGAVADLPAEAVAMLMAFLAGGAMLNVLKEELPEERKSRFSAFFAGAVLYGLLLLAK